MRAARIRLLIASFWVGSMWTIGYLVAPTLFASLADKGLAGTIAGKLFRIEAWLSVGAVIALWVLLKTGSGESEGRAGKQLRWLTLGMLACTLVGYFALQPFMAELRAAAGPGGVMDAATKARFGLLHGVSSVFYLIQSLLGALLIWKLR
ncbi:MAG TPA: DUF4149 domain-containing protein [Noviherbaspirillum sp.]|uniref:DUF4149 domain-containing protein n=1 Tax=Noviherbaspirillum sp. TaxID=1926288 RepID=UPI002B491630|nr:DUF4149 domain-containing protein [Noviherbaspirillum sp.]HJV85595.1 DUF4149 domain-containing protein [Noviherbaspirillum sp.]